MGIRSWLIINSNNVIINGERIFTDVSGKDLLKFLYRLKIKDYPKFYKMDLLCRLGIVASEMLFNSVEIDESDKENMSIILFNRSGSLANDMAYQGTISVDDYYPSPSVFVYTLANIVTGEIAIKNKIYGETSFYISNDLYPKQMSEIVNSSIQTSDNSPCICGWLECQSDNSFESVLFFLDNSSHIDFSEENINRIINFNKSK